MENTHSNDRRPFANLIYALIYATGALYFSYFFLVNLLLFLHFPTWLASEGKGLSFNISYSYAWSLSPGKLRIRSLKLDGTDENVHWEVTIAKVDIDLKLKDLFRKRFHVSRLISEEATFLVHSHTEQERDPVLSRLKKHDQENSTKSAHPWTVSLDRITVNRVKKADFDWFYFEGESDVTGAFELQPGKRLKIPMSRWAFRDGTFKKDGVLILNELNGEGDVVIHPTSLPEISGNEIFRTMDIDFKFKSHIFDAQIFGALLKPYRPMVFGKTDGIMRSRVNVRRGVLLPGSFIQGDLQRLDLKLAGASLFGKGALRWDVTDVDSPIANFSLLLGDVDWRDAWSGKSPKLLAHSRSFALTAQSRVLSLVDPFTDLAIALSVRKAEIGKLQSIFGHFSKNREQDGNSFPIRSNRGSFDLDARIQPSRRAFTAEFRYQAKNLRLTHDEGRTQLKVNLRSTVKVSSGNYDEHRIDLNEAKIAMSDIHVRRNGKNDYESVSWVAKVALKKGLLVVNEGRYFLSGDLELASTDMKTPAHYAIPGTFWLSFGLFLFPMRDFNGLGKLEMDQQRFRVSDFKGRSSSGTIEASFLLDEGKSAYSILTRLLPVTVCASRNTLGKSKVVAFNSAQVCQGIASTIGKVKFDTGGAPVIW